MASRASSLAIKQSNLVIELMKKKFPNIQININKIITKGDKDKRPFYMINQNGVFEKEVNEKLLRNDADFAVHSLKDLHDGLAKELTIACIPKRERSNDVFINITNTKKLDKLTPGSIVATSSIRRAIQIKTNYPNIKIKSIRGNIETRIHLSKRNNYVGLILAEAGIKRLNLGRLITQRLSTVDFTPSPGQGALAIVCRKDNNELISILKKIENTASAKEIQAERSLVEFIGAGCTIPMGALASLNRKNNILRIHTKIYSLDGNRLIEATEEGSGDNPIELGEKVARKLIADGALEISKEWNNNMNNEMLNSLIE